MTAAFSPPFPTNPNVGDTFCGWTWNGAMWICTSSQFIRVQRFIVSGPYTPTPGLLSGISECWGGGGGGGAAFAGAAGTTFAYAGAGGGSGGYSRYAFSADMVRGGVLVTVGGGGTAGAGPTGNLSGGAGGATSFGVMCIANGGAGGQGSNGVDQFGEGGVVAGPGVGDIAAPGNGGFSGGFMDLGTMTWSGVQGGMGGSLALGGARSLYAGPTSSNPGIDGYAETGAGGQGAQVNLMAQGSGQSGGRGGSGLAIVTEFIFADQGGSWSGGGCGGGQARVAWPGPGPCPPGWGGGFDD